MGKYNVALGSQQPVFFSLDFVALKILIFVCVDEPWRSEIFTAFLFYFCFLSKSGFKQGRKNSFENGYFSLFGQRRPR